MASEGTGRRVLLVENEEADRTAVARALRTHGARYALVEAVTGAEGLAICRGGNPPDCVLLDFFLPDMTAIEFLRQLQQGDARTVALPVAVLTSHDDDRSAADALANGAEDFLRKDSIEPHTLMRAIENAIERHRIRRELEEQRAVVEARNRNLELLRDELQAKVAELADATRAKDRFLAVMSHEMRTPLNAILGYSDLLDLEMDGPLTEGQRAQLQRIRVGSRHLLDLINNVLDLTRADVRKLELDVRPVDVVAVVEEVVALLESEALMQGLSLRFVAPAAPVPLVEADLQRLRQIVTNLVGNALKFTDEGSVTVSIEVPEDGMVAVRVEDTGIGIDADTIPLVFDEFYQVKGDLTRRHGGSGLGLAISQQLAELMGGTITVESRLGEGSTFTLRLPRAGAGEAARQQDVEDHRDWAGRRDAGPREPIAVVALGADPTALAELQQRVAPTVRLAWTVNPAHLVELASEEHPSLVLVDISSPNSEFWSAALALQEHPALRDKPILLLPSMPASTTGDKMPGLDLGWVSLIPKPFTAAQLTSAISRARGPQGEKAKHVCSVLIVDDDEDSRRVAAKFLKDERVATREAADGETALEEMRMSPPDVVVLDLMMPVLDGFGVIAAMRADPMLRGIPVVVLTAKSLTTAERQFLSKTAARVLQKGQHRLADVAALVLRAATQSPAPVTIPSAGP